MSVLLTEFRKDSYVPRTITSTRSRYFEGSTCMCDWQLSSAAERTYNRRSLPEHKYYLVVDLTSEMKIVNCLGSASTGCTPLVIPTVLNFFHSHANESSQENLKPS